MRLPLAPPTRVVALAGLTVLLSACGGTSPSPTIPATDCPTAAPTAGQATEVIGDARRVEVTTSLGTFTVELYPDAAPIATANFVALVRCGFYEGITFHRVLAGFVAQAGDPQTRQDRGDFPGLGTGGPGYSFVIEPVAPGYDYDPYVVAMAHSQLPDSNASQFFIDLADLAGGLPREYTIFGRVVEGTAVIDAIGSVAVNDPNIGVPLTPVVIERMAVVP